ncbi:MAG: FAD-binding oxidoreductase, partial [Acidimicrobiales bacterium]
MTDALIADLRRIVGRSGVLLGSDLATATVDHRGACRGEAAALVRPCSTEEVAAVVRLCARRSSKIVTQGGNTGLSGGATPTGHRTSVIVSLGRMNRIESLDPGRGSALVQAGVTIEALQQAAASVDRMFAPDWGARGSATIGGAISTNAGGINVLAFGTTREHVLGLEVVLADGRTWNGLRTLRKDSSGYDLKQLFIGAEGTLGIVTRAVVRLLPSATHQATAMAAIDSLGSLAPLLALAQDHAQGGLTAFELLPEMGVEAVVARHG